MSLVGFGVAGCTATKSTIDWVPVAVPGTPVLLRSLGDQLLVGITDSAGRPGLCLPQGADWRVVPVVPKTGYGETAVWRALAIDSRDGIVGIGHAVGGAHGNARWTVWRGDGSNVVEQPQVLGTFGGLAGGALYDVVAAATGTFLVGTWSGAEGMDVSTWHLAGDTWVRRESAGTALASTLGGQVSVAGGAPVGEGAVLVGAVTQPGEEVSRAAVLWRGGDSGWERLDLPADGRLASAEGVATDGDRALVLGRVDGRLTGWRVGATGGPESVRLPDRTLADDVVLAPPVIADGRGLAVVPSGGDSSLVVEGSGGWSVRGGPPGTPVQIAVVQPDAYVVTVTDGTTRLWRGAW